MGKQLAEPADAADMPPTEVWQRWRKWSHRQLRDCNLDAAEQEHLEEAPAAQLAAMA
ncbi:hypothetical protein AB0K48_08075 [Nonomuraea sp. NPDC055795]